VVLDEKDPTFRSDSEYISVHASIPPTALATLNIGTLRLSAGNRSALVPVEAPVSAGLDATIEPRRDIAV
jgi:hypothetical protein